MLLELGLGLELVLLGLGPVQARLELQLVQQVPRGLQALRVPRVQQVRREVRER